MSRITSGELGKNGTRSIRGGVLIAGNIPVDDDLLMESYSRTRAIMSFESPILQEIMPYGIQHPFITRLPRHASSIKPTFGYSFLSSWINSTFDLYSQSIA